MPDNRPIRLVGLVLLIVLGACAVVLGRASAQAPDTGQLEQGARLFAQNCAVCHGEHGEGRIGASLAKDWPSIRPDLTVKATIENGIPGSVMPAWGPAKGGPLSEDDINALVAFILSLSSGNGPVITPSGPTPTARPPIAHIPNVQGDPNQGAVLFDKNCAVCHGANGEGRIGAPLAKVWPSVRPDLAIQNTIRNGIPGSVMPAWGQERGGPLSDQNVNDLVSFILSRSRSGVVQSQESSPPVPAVPLSWLSGWGGVLLFLLLFIVIIAGAIIIQRKP